MLRIILLIAFLTYSLNIKADPVFFTETDSTSQMIFNSELKVDQSIPFGYQRGDDMYLQNGYSGHEVSTNVDFHSYNSGHCLDDVSNIFDWSISRDEEDVTFSVDDYTLTNSSSAGEWDGLALLFDTRGRNNMFDSAWITLTINQWNGNELESPFVFTSYLGEVNYLAIVDDQQLEITDISGTVEYSWEPNYWYSRNNSPNDTFSLAWGGYTIEGWNPLYDDIIIDETGNITDVENVSAPDFNFTLFALSGLAAFYYRQRNTVVKNK